MASDPLARTDARSSPGALSRALVAALVLTALYLGRDILVPLALAGLIGFALEPLVRALWRRGLPRGVGAPLVVALVLATGLWLGTLVSAQLALFAADLPAYRHSIQSKLEALRDRVRGPGALTTATRVLDQVTREVNAAPPAGSAPAPGGGATARPAAKVQIEQAPPTTLESLGALAAPLVSPAITAGFVVVLVIFLLLDRHDLRDRVIRLLGGDLRRGSDAFAEAAERVGRYLLAQVAVNGGFGLALALGLSVVGVPGAWLWGALAAVFRFVPYAGPLVAAVAPLSVAFAVGPDWSMVLWTASLVVLLELVFNNVVEPLAFGASTGLSPLAVLLCTAFWASLWGPVGLLLAMPLTVCAVAFGRHMPALHAIDVLLGDRPALSPAMRLHQRLLSGDVEAAVELADEQVRLQSAQSFRLEVALPMLGHAASLVALGQGDHLARVAQGLDEVLAELGTDEAATARPGATAWVCVPVGRRPVDLLAARLLAEALGDAGLAAAWGLPSPWPAGARALLVAHAQAGVGPIGLQWRRTLRRMAGTGTGAALVLWGADDADTEAVSPAGLPAELSPVWRRPAAALAALSDPAGRAAQPEAGAAQLALSP